MTVAVIAVRPLADQVWTLLDALPNVNAYDGEVSDDPPLDQDGRVHPYAVFYPDAGRRFPVRLGPAPNKLAWGFQVTCVGGDSTRCLWCVDRVAGLLTGRSLAVGARATGRIGEDGRGPVRRDDDTSPPRFYVPLVFAVTI